MKYIMSLDQGTTSSRCILFDHAGNIRATAQREFRQIFPQPGWVEHDALEIWRTTMEVTKNAMEQDSGIPITALKVDGGACANDFLMEFQSNIPGCDVHRPKCIETTALGAAYLAGLAVGYWKSLEDIRSNWAIDRVFTPAMARQEREKRLKGWHKAVKCAIVWGEEE